MEKRISGHTGLLALIGSPVGHSGSPAMYNYSFEKLGLDYAYVAFDIKEDKVKDAIAAMKTFNMRGCNVTMPDKVEAAKYMDELSSREKAQMDAPQSALQDSAKDTPEGMSSLSAAEQRKLKKEQEAKERRIRRQKESLETDIASLENDISCLEAELCLEENMKDHIKLTALSEELADKKGELELKYEEWLILQE